MSLWLQNLAFEKTVPVLLGVALLAALDLVSRYRKEKYHYVFGCLLGTTLGISFLHFVPSLFNSGIANNPFALGFSVLLVFAGWRLLFGPWETHVKATVLGTFLFWITMALIIAKPAEQKPALLISMAFALVPAIFWCALFLPYHKEQLSRVFLMFFAGMASTAPILFYDALVRGGGHLHFFYFRLVPESFNTSTQMFVQNQMQAVPSLQTTLFTIALTFVFVALIEEFSKYWVLRKSGEKFFTSIDDVLELSIVVAIGFAFAENILNSSYFPSFVQRYLLHPESRDWLAFTGNIAGRSVLTSMVHIASTGIMGYFVGRSIFASSLLASDHVYPVTNLLSRVLELPRIAVFRTMSVTCALLFGVSSHALANFLVTMPDALPGNPRTMGDLLGSSSDSILHSVSLVIIPSLLYVVGGYLLLTWLLEWKENRAERAIS